MEPQLVMLNSEIPAARSGRTPFYSEALAKAYHHFFHLAHQNGERLVFASAYDYDWNGNVSAHWAPYADRWIPVDETIPIGAVFEQHLPVPLAHDQGRNSRTFQGRRLDDAFEPRGEGDSGNRLLVGRDPGGRAG